MANVGEFIVDEFSGRSALGIRPAQSANRVRAPGPRCDSRVRATPRGIAPWSAKAGSAPGPRDAARVRAAPRRLTSGATVRGRPSSARHLARVARFCPRHDALTHVVDGRDVLDTRPASTALFHAMHRRPTPGTPAVRSAPDPLESARWRAVPRQGQPRRARHPAREAPTRSARSVPFHADNGSYADIKPSGRRLGPRVVLPSCRPTPGMATAHSAPHPLRRSNRLGWIEVLTF